MIILIGPDNGGIAHVNRSLADSWPGQDGGAQLLEISDAGHVTRAHCACSDRDGPAAAGGSTAWRAARAAWRHRRCVRASTSLHLELGRVSLSAFWFGLVASLLAPRVPLVVTTHDIPHVVLHPGAALVPRGPGLRDRFAYRVVAPLLDGVVLGALRRRTSATVVLSAAAAAEAGRQGWPRVRHVDHGAAPRTPGTASAGAAGYVLLAGFLGPGKGLDVLAEAWPDVRGGLPLVIAGGHSPDHAAWVAAARQRLDTLAPPPTWSGFVEDEEFARLVRDSAVVVIPYVQSNPASGVLIRALVEGRAVVGTRVAAVVEEVIDGVNGLLVEPGDAPALAAAITRLAESPELRDRVGEEAARRAATRHAWSAHSGILATLHGELSSPHPSRSRRIPWLSPSQ